MARTGTAAGADTDGLAGLAPVIVWFRNDLRLTDNPALNAAVAEGAPIICLYILEDDDGPDAPRRMGGACRWWLHRSLAAFDSSLSALGGRLVLRRGDPRQIVLEIADQIGADRITWNRRYDRPGIERDAALKAALKERGVRAESFNSALLHEPWSVRTKTGGIYKVFTPFWKAECALPPAERPLPSPLAINWGPTVPSDRLEDWELRPSAPNWAASFDDLWTPGESGANKRLDVFLDQIAAGYAHSRDRLAEDGTSRLSPHLRFGELGPRQIWHAVHAAAASRGQDPMDGGFGAFLREIGWRDFSYNLLFHFPELPTVPLQPRFTEFPWRADRQALRAWQRGQTGYPVVDAAMRQLWQTGWMHNRARMIVGSFLVKHLLLPWQMGEAWFWDTLVDADPASNPASWQWVAGCGADAAPYFRVFNPVLQGQKFDPDGVYVRRWVPELAASASKTVHEPWAARDLELRAAGIRLGETYPRPIVDHKSARNRALAAFGTLSGTVQHAGAA